MFAKSGTHICWSNLTGQQISVIRLYDGIQIWITWITWTSNVSSKHSYIVKIWLISVNTILNLCMLRSITSRGSPHFLINSESLWHLLEAGSCTACCIFYLVISLTLMVSRCCRKVSSASLLGRNSFPWRLLGGRVVGTANSPLSASVLPELEGLATKRGRGRFLKPRRF